MLLIQNIQLTWDKKERDTKGANARKQFSMAYPFPQTNIYDNIVLHYQSFYQCKTKFLNTFYSKKNFFCYHSIEQVNLPNVTICQREKEYEICFSYHYGIPYRRGHNKDYHNMQSQFYRKDCLNEIAFILKQNQYGRMVWNDRTIDLDTGNWYYNIYIHNFYVANKMPQKNILVSHTPDFEYKQMVMLY